MAMLNNQMVIALFLDTTLAMFVYLLGYIIEWHLACWVDVTPKDWRYFAKHQTYVVRTYSFFPPYKGGATVR